MIRRRVADEKLMGLIEKIVYSFHNQPGKGIPLGNLTSQLFSNIYLDELDQFITKRFGFQNYIRYADDIVVIARSKIFLESITIMIRDFLESNLQLTLHPKKIVLRKWHQGVDFLGYVTFPHYTILRTKTKRRLLKRLKIKYEKFNQGLLENGAFEQSLQSYLGVLKHCRGYGIRQQINNLCHRD
ncbi:MAG: RNA-directed DNA polymerase (Reverse transcriptase) [Candidatus Magasanikbacteria bacterium]|nr:RNA-directed DNA polymerase (Reverse transcriptase) [Candidatus Magasanikbacteria bacterium]